MKKHSTDLSQNNKIAFGRFYKKGVYMKNEVKFNDVVNDCKKLIRKENKSIHMTVEKRENEYYNTEIISVKNKISGKEMFVLRIESDEVSAGYHLYCDNNDYMPKSWCQNRKLEKLRKIAERYAIKQYVAYIRG